MSETGKRTSDPTYVICPYCGYQHGDWLGVVQSGLSETVTYHAKPIVSATAGSAP